MKTDQAFRGGTVVTAEHGPIRADIGVVGGRIVAIGPSESMRAQVDIDARGLLVLPGAVDLHVHFRDPGQEAKEDFATGTAAAACGGVTTVCDMPNTVPAVIDADRLTIKRDLVSRKAYVDFALWVGGTAIDEFPAMQQAGAVGLKVYMNRSHRADDPYSDELSMPDLERFGEVLEASTRLGWPTVVHACDHAEEATLRRSLHDMSTTDARLVCRSFRGTAALDGVRQTIELAEQTGAAVHIAHISLAPTQAVALVEAARRRGVRITCECGPPALLEDELAILGVYGTPFAFAPQEAELYWNAIADGRIDVIATDHAPHSRADKDVGRDDVWLAPPGYPGVETSLPLMVDAALRGVLDFSRLVEVTSTGPARIAGFSNKGQIRVGSDADLVLVDPNGRTVIDQDQLHSKAGWSPFTGRKLRGHLQSVYLRGRQVAADGELVATSPAGQMLRRSMSVVPVTGTFS